MAAYASPHYFLPQSHIGTYQRLLDQKWYVQIKRLLDLFVCAVTVPFWLPLLVICAILIRLDSPQGPIFFLQERVGQYRRRFRVYKFRTLTPDYDERQARKFMKAFVAGQISHDDSGKNLYKPFTKSQVTRVGHFLRLTSLDELPQVLNVLRGEMSLIGPRPNVLWEVEAYQKWHYERLDVLPGITGLAQIQGRSGIPFNQIARYDIQYARNQSLKLDLEILCRTVSSVLSARGAG